MKSLIECRDLAKSYRNGDPETPVLRGLTFTIAEGECVAIMGPSGSGKSTLVNILGCLDTPTSGTYLLDGRDVSDLSDDDLAAIRNEKLDSYSSHIISSRAPRYFETYFFRWCMRIQAARIAKQRPQRRYGRQRFLTRFGPTVRNQLSGGMMQRVAIARACEQPFIAFGRRADRKSRFKDR